MNRWSTESKIIVLFLISVTLLIALVLWFILSTDEAHAHAGTLDAYGCHSNKVLFGTTAKRECHADLLAGQVFSSTTAEYKAYIAAQRTQLVALDVEVTKAKADLQACKDQCATMAPFKLVVAWNPNQEADLAGYKVYCGTTPGNYTITQTILKPQTVFVLTGVPPAKYYCAVAAFDKTGNESAKSNEFSNTFP